MKYLNKLILNNRIKYKYNNIRIKNRNKLNDIIKKKIIQKTLLIIRFLFLCFLYFLLLYYPLVKYHVFLNLFYLLDSLDDY